MKISNLINDNFNPSRNQFVVETEKDIYFQSYDTMIAKYNKNTNHLTLSSAWNYSNITSKHLFIFIRNHTIYSVLNRKDVRKNIKNNTFSLVDSIDF